MCWPLENFAVEQLSSFAAFWFCVHFNGAFHFDGLFGPNFICHFADEITLGTTIIGEL
jgi:hypothetical protein